MTTLPKVRQDTILEPELTDAQAQLKLDIFRTMNCVAVGEIQSFDSTKKTVTVQHLFKRVLADGTTKSRPILLDVPVLTLQGGGGAITFPITKGDQCLLLFSDRNLDAWYQNGAEAPPFTDRAHDISDGIAIVGLNALTSAVSPYEASAVKLSFGGAIIKLKGGKLSIENATTTLLTLIDGLIDAIVALQVVGNLALTPASIAALQAQKLLFAGLLNP